MAAHGSDYNVVYSNGKFIATFDQLAADEVVSLYYADDSTVRRMGYLTVETVGDYIEVVADGWKLRIDTAIDWDSYFYYITDPSNTIYFYGLDNINDGSNTYNAAYDTNRVTTVICDTPLKAQILVTGNYDRSSSTTQNLLSECDGFEMLFTVYPDRFVKDLKISMNSSLTVTTAHYASLAHNGTNLTNEDNVYENSGNESNSTTWDQFNSAKYVGVIADEMNLASVVLSNDMGSTRQQDADSGEWYITSYANLTAQDYHFVTAFFIDSADRQNDGGTFLDWDTDIDGHFISANTICEQSADSLRYICHTAHLASALTEPPDTDYWHEYRMTLGDQYKDLEFGQYHGDVDVFIKGDEANSDSLKVGTGTVTVSTMTHATGPDGIANSAFHSTGDGDDSDYVEFNSNGNINGTQGKLGFWYKHNDTSMSSYASLIGHSGASNAFRLRLLSATSVLQYYPDGSGSQTITTIDYRDSNWHYWEHVYDTDAATDYIEIWIDGALQQRWEQAMSALDTSSGTFIIGNFDGKNRDCGGDIWGFWASDNVDAVSPYAPATGTVVSDLKIPANILAHASDGFAADGARHLESDAIKDFSLIQSTATVETSDSNFPKTITISSTASGNDIFVFLFIEGTESDTFTVSDDQTNTYTSLVREARDSSLIEVYRATNR